VLCIDNRTISYNSSEGCVNCEVEAQSDRQLRRPPYKHPISLKNTGTLIAAFSIVYGIIVWNMFHSTDEEYTILNAVSTENTGSYNTDMHELLTSLEAIINLMRANIRV
jgi:hypothetical protein